MAKQPKRPAASPAESDARVPHPEFHFSRFIVIASSMRELARTQTAAPDQTEQVDRGTTEIAVGAKVSITGDVGALILDVSVTPDPAMKPYEIKVTVAGEFAMKKGGTQEKFAAFMKSNAAAIIFPYIRQVIDQITADGRYGRVRLDPLNLHGMLNQSAWSEEPPLAQEGSSPRESQ